MPTDPQRIEVVFLAAAEIRDPAERARFLDGACGADSGLKARVEALLRAHDQPDSLLDHPAVSRPEPGYGPTQAFSAPDSGHGSSETAEDEVPLGFLKPPTRPDAMGRIGHYEVLQVLGQGGFGIVFRAFDDVLHRVVAVKVLSPQMAATSPARKRFLREARSSAQVRHENVVQVHEVGEQPLPYIAMEFIPGETLQQRLDRVGPVEPAEVVRIGRQIAEGLAAAHATDLIHRDIKPGNVLLEGGHQKVKITDFGLARAADDASISQSGLIAGTPIYMAPEQAKGEKLDQRADLFSLGSVLYQMASGRPPFRANTTVAVLKRVAEEAPRPIREIIPETPQWLCDIIAKLHAKDPADRYQSAREVADVLADCEAQLKNHSRLKDYSRIPRNKPQRSGRGKWAAVAAAVVLLPVIALAATEFAGVTHLLRLGPPKRGADQPGHAADASFDVKQAQESSAKQWGVPVETTNSIGMKLRLIPAGKFMMGSSKEEIDFWLKQKHDGWYKDLLLSERPQHEVEITQPFYMGQADVTVGQFRQFVKATGYKTQAEREGGAVRGFPNGGFNDVANTDWLNPGFAQTDDHPVVCVSWNDAVEFCQWLSKQEGKTYRLPTEAEWEYSCRAGSRGRWSFGDDEGELWDYARVGGNSQNHSWPVAGLKANAWGLYDMHGNVQQWCQDLFDPNYYKTSPPKDPPGPAVGDERVIRGGLWLWGADVSRSAMRNKTNPAGRANFCGFRVVLVVSPPAGVQSESGAKDKPSPTTIAPFTDADVKRIAALPAEQQVEEVRKELMRRNPDFDGAVAPTIEKDAVTGLKFTTDHVTDISPVHALTRLQTLDMGSYPRFDGLLFDLSPLQGMPLVRLECGGTKVADLSPLKGMKLYRLGAQGISASDLTPLQGMPLTYLDLAYVLGVTNLKPLQGMPLEYLNLSLLPVSDLSALKGMTSLKALYLQDMTLSDLAPLSGMRLHGLYLAHTKVSDLTPLKGMPLEEIQLNPRNITEGLDILRDMKSLKRISANFDPALPAAEFWERYDKGEFTK